VVLSHDTSGCSCSVVALPAPSDAVPACWCVSTPVMRAAVSTSWLSNIVVLLFYMCVTCGIHSLFAVAVFLLCRALVCTWIASLCVVVTCATVTVSLRCRVG
jgi:hypothetical protein